MLEVTSSNSQTRLTPDDQIIHSCLWSSCLDITHIIWQVQQ